MEIGNNTNWGSIYCLLIARLRKHNEEMLIMQIIHKSVSCLYLLHSTESWENVLRVFKNYHSLEQRDVSWHGWNKASSISVYDVSFSSALL